MKLLLLLLLGEEMLERVGGGQHGIAGHFRMRTNTIFYGWGVNRVSLQHELQKPAIGSVAHVSLLFIYSYPRGEGDMGIIM